VLALPGFKILPRPDYDAPLLLEPHEGNVVLEIFDAIGDENRDLLSR
jgi:hypothetical protein